MSFHTARVRSGPLAMSARCPVWRKVDMAGSPRDVREVPIGDICSAAKTPSFYDLVSGDLQRIRHGEAKHLRGSEVDEKFDLRGLLDRQVGRHFTLENPAGINATQSVVVRNIGTVAQQTTGRGKLAILIYCGHCVAKSQCGELFTAAREE